MKNLRTLILAVVALAVLQVDARAENNFRPISDFVKAQGTFCFPAIPQPPPGTRNENGCWLAIPSMFSPGIPNFLAELTYNQTPVFGFPWALIDYAGLTVKYIKNNGGPDIGTTFSGSISERPLSDGRAEVQVLLFTTNALAWVVDECACHGGPDNLLFGAKPDQVALRIAPPTLADSFFQIDFIEAHPGDPMPDLFQLLFFPRPGQESISAGFRAKAQGPLHNVPGEQDVVEGTPGMLTVLQANAHINGFINGFPGAVVDLKPIGQ